MAYKEALAMFAKLAKDFPQDAVEEHTWAGLWDNAARMWATEREQSIGDAVRELSETLFRHEPAIGLLALYIVGNRSRQTAVQMAWVHDFAAALKRVADDVVPVTVPPPAWAGASRVSGVFADRGVHTMKGSVRTVFQTPCLADMACRWCQAHGVTVTALQADDRLLGWCCLAHARLDGLRMPGIARAPLPLPLPQATENDQMSELQPLYWQHETSGVLAPVVEAYLRGDHLTAREVAVMRTYLRQWMDGPWRGPLVDELRAKIDEILDRDGIARWLLLAADAEIDPL